MTNTVNYDSSILQPRAAQVPTATQPQAPNSGWQQTLLIVAVIAAGFWFMANRNSGQDGGNGPDVDPRPTPSVNVAGKSEAIWRTFTASVGRDSRTIAAGIRGGQLNSIDDIIADAKARWTVSHEQLIQESGLLDDANVPQELDESNREALAKYYDQFGIGIERIAK